MFVDMREAPVAAPPAANQVDLLEAWTSSNALVYCRDADGRFAAANRSFLRKFGRGAAELTGTEVSALVHPSDVGGGRTGAFLPQSGTREQRWLTPQGWRWICWEEIPLLDPSGRVVAVRAIGHDITRQRLAEEQYLKLSRAVEQSPVSIVITGSDGHAQYVNAKFTQTTGHTLEELIDQRVPVLRDGHTTEEEFAAFMVAVQSGRPWQGDLARICADGSRVWESVQVSALRNPAGEVTNFVCMREDITQRKLLEDQLRQAQKMESLGTLAGGIAHDFNNLLAVINGYAELSLVHNNDPQLLSKGLREILGAAQRASGLVRQILTFSRKAEVRFAALDLNQQTKDLVALLAETFPRNVTFQLALAPKLPPLLADQNQLQQILLNLCVNARDAMPSGGTITAATSLRPGREFAARQAAAQIDRNYACLEITDTGTGMTPEVKARIFEPFFTTKPGNQGTGLGLAVVYGIVTAHRGFLEVDSTPGIGSTFRILLPLGEATSVAAPTTANTHFPGGTESLLVVDDEAGLRRLLDAAFSQKGYHIACVCSGLEAIEAISDESRHIDAVLLDVNMPGATGLDVLRVIRATRPELKVLVLSGHLTPAARIEFEKLGQKDFVSKPYRLDDLGRRLRVLLDTK